MEIDLFLIFNIALSASLGHCIGMCGGIVLAINTKIAKNHHPPLLCNLLYNFGRIFSYMIIGALCGGVGKVFEINLKIKGGVLILIGVLTACMGISLLFSPKILSRLEPSISNMSGFKNFFSSLLKSRHITSFFLLGMLNGFLPCGIVYYFALVALGSAQMWKGIAIMGVFGVSTLFPMLVAGILSSLLLNSSFKTIMLKISAFAMMVLGFFTIYKGIKLF